MPGEAFIEQHEHEHEWCFMGDRVIEGSKEVSLSLICKDMACDARRLANITANLASALAIEETEREMIKVKDLMENIRAREREGEIKEMVDKDKGDFDE